MPSCIHCLLGTHPCLSETFIQREIDGLRARGWQVAVSSLRGESALRPTREDRRRAFQPAILGSALRHALPLLPCCPSLPLHLLRHLPQAAALARLAGSSPIHAHFAHLPADIAALAARACGVAFTCGVHAWDVFAQPPRAVRRRLSQASRVVACSQAALDAVAAAGVSPGRIALVRHGIPLHACPFNPQRPPDRLLGVGRLERKKGWDVLIRACAQTGGRFTCRIVGDGHERQKLARLIARHGLNGRVLLDGAQPPERARKLMQQATLLVLPSRRMPNGDRDGVANALVEAMALGTPAITTTAGAAGEIVRDGESGRLVPPDDPAALARAIAESFADARARDRLAAAARCTIEALYDEMQTLPQLERALLGESALSR